MEPWKKEFDDLLSSSLPITVCYWVTILNFFELYKDELSIKELEKLVDKCDKIRLEFNKGSTDPIYKKDTSPNVYDYLDERIKIKNKEEEFRETCYAIPA